MKFSYCRIGCPTQIGGGIGVEEEDVVVHPTADAP
jgi:hypothetical protein